MIIVHHLEHSRSQRVLWLLEELGVPYEVRRYPRDGDYRAPAALRAVHPLGKSPVIEADGLRLAETGAIAEFVLARHDREGRLTPPADTPEHWQARHFLHHAEGSAMPPLVMRLVFGLVPRRAPLPLRPILRPVMKAVDARLVAPQLAALAAYWEGAVASTGWFAGRDLSIADIMMSFPVEAAASRGVLADRPALADFLARIHARPAHRAALARGGPYAYA